MCTWSTSTKHLESRTMTWFWWMSLATSTRTTKPIDELQITQSAWIHFKYSPKTAKLVERNINKPLVDYPRVNSFKNRSQSLSTNVVLLDGKNVMVAPIMPTYAWPYPPHIFPLRCLCSLCFGLTTLFGHKHHSHYVRNAWLSTPTQRQRNWPSIHLRSLRTTFEKPVFLTGCGHLYCLSCLELLFRRVFLFRNAWKCIVYPLCLSYPRLLS